MIGGYAQTIAASGGWVQGGGHSVLSPNYGLGVDRVVSNSSAVSVSSPHL